MQGNGHSPPWMESLKMEMMMQVETMSAFARHVTSPRLTAMPVVGHFFYYTVGMETNPSF
jgi:hypothetical protein